jgi:hypothetical protein
MNESNVDGVTDENEEEGLEGLLDDKAIGSSSSVGCEKGCEEGSSVGEDDGVVDGLFEGLPVGKSERRVDGTSLGLSVGPTLGSSDGSSVGSVLGSGEGTRVGSVVGVALGVVDGSTVRSSVTTLASTSPSDGFMVEVTELLLLFSSFIMRRRDDINTSFFSTRLVPRIASTLTIKER